MGSYDLYTKGTSAAQQAKFKETARVLATGKTDTEGENTNLNIPLSDISGDKLPTVGEVGQVLKKTANGAAWDNEKTELPTEGTAGQVLKKTANGVKWDNEKTELPTNGNVGDVLKKTADGSEWVNMFPPFPPDADTKSYVLGIKDGKIDWVEDQTGGGGS